MTVLGIETATERLGAALLIEHDHRLYERHVDSRTSHCELLTGFVMEIVREANIPIDELDCVAVSIGPGSFTGLRIGIATAMGLAYGLGIPVCGISTLEGLAAQVAISGELVCPLIDAKRSEVYTALYRGSQNNPREVKSPCTLQIAELEDTLRSTGETITVTGPAAAMFESYLTEALGSSVAFTSPAEAKPSAAAIAALGLAIHRSGKSIHPAALKPLYLRRSDAEIARNPSKTPPGASIP